MEETRFPWRTEFVVQPFVLTKRKVAVAPLRPAGGHDQAIRLGERLAPASIGVVVLSRRCAPTLGEYEAPVILATHGEVPPEVLEQLAA